MDARKFEEGKFTLEDLHYDTRQVSGIDAGSRCFANDAAGPRTCVSGRQNSLVSCTSNHALTSRLETGFLGRLARCLRQEEDARRACAAVDAANIDHRRAQGRSVREIVAELGYSRSFVHKTLANCEPFIIATAAD